MTDLAHRRGEVRLTVLDVDGRPLAHNDISVEQTRHAFAFGNIGFDFVRLAGGPEPADLAGVESFGGARDLTLDRLADPWLNLFNTVTLPFYWGRYERRRGRPDTDRLRRTAEWFSDRGVTVKGHPLVWHTLEPPWLLALPHDEVERALRARVRDLAGGFAGLVDTWDAVNEAVIVPVYANGASAVTRLAWTRGRIALVRLAFEEARAANPAATLILNDFDLSSAYECLIEGLLEAGVRIDAIGLQTHMQKGFRGEEQLRTTLDRFARFGLPLHLTESTLVSGHLMPAEIEDLNDYRIPHWPSTPEGEQRQADDIARLYRCLVGHPAVRAVTYWGFTDDGAWLGAPTGLLRADGTGKPAYDALDRLIRGEWWLAPTPLRTDPRGRVAVRGFQGDYAVTASAGRRATFPVGPEVTDRVVRLRAA